MTARPRRIVLALALLLVGSASAQTPAPSDKARPMFVETQHLRTFGARQPTPAGTVFAIRVVKKGNNDAFRLHRCGEPCKTSTMVAMWKPEAYRAGDELSWRTTEPGTYYMWNQDLRTEASVPAFTNEFMGKRLRIVWESGAVIEAWYVLP